MTSNRRDRKDAELCELGYDSFRVFMEKTIRATTINRNGTAPLAYPCTPSFLFPMTPGVAAEFITDLPSISNIGSCKSRKHRLFIKSFLFVLQGKHFKISHAAMRNLSKLIMALILDLDLLALTSLSSCDFASITYPETYNPFGTTELPHTNTGMNRKAPKPDLCISTTSSIICCEHLPTIFIPYKNCGRQPPTPLHIAPPFQHLLTHSSYHDPLQNQVLKHGQAGFLYLFRAGSK